MLASNGDEPTYIKLVKALCAENRISLIREADKKNVRKQAGLCKTDQEGKPSKVVGCSSIEVKDYGKEGHQKLLQKQEMNN